MTLRFDDRVDRLVRREESQLVTREMIGCGLVAHQHRDRFCFPIFPGNPQLFRGRLRAPR